MVDGGVGEVVHTPVTGAARAVREFLSWRSTSVGTAPGVRVKGLAVGAASTGVAVAHVSSRGASESEKDGDLKHGCSWFGWLVMKLRRRSSGSNKQFFVHIVLFDIFGSSAPFEPHCIELNNNSNSSRAPSSHRCIDCQFLEGMCLCAAACLLAARIAREKLTLVCPFL